MQQVHLDLTEEKMVKKQIALEYLIKAFIIITVERAYHLIKLRNLFLHAKALMIDLSYLGLESSKLSETIRKIMHVRNNWFEHHVSRNMIMSLVHQYHVELHEQLSTLFKKEKIYLPAGSNFKVSRNIYLQPDDAFSVLQQGIVPPKNIAGWHPKIPRVFNRMNKFIVSVPADQQAIPDVVKNRHNSIAEMVSYQQSCLPYFIPTAFGLNIFNGQV
jgi:hypothetical protein